MSVNEVANKELIEFKGSRNGLIVNVKKPATFEQIKSNIIERLESAVGFFNGAKICKINCKYLNDIQIIQIKDDISSRFDVEFVELEHEDVVIRSFNTKYVNNLRSGENIEFDGDVIIMKDMKSGSQVNSTSNVVVMGNVDPGAKVVANGNIIVMGQVKGFIHAGADGNENAYVVASDFKPKVLKIANNFAEAPEDDSYEEEKQSGPEIAFISDGRMVVESYLSKQR